jgi:hypothetical protein
MGPGDPLGAAGLLVLGQDSSHWLYSSLRALNA